MLLQNPRRVPSPPQLLPVVPLPPGSNEPHLPSCGTYFRELRERRRLSRQGVIERYESVVVYNDPTAPSISEAQIKRFEEDQLIKLSRRFIEGLAQAIACRPPERIQLLLLADKNPFAQPNGTMEPEDVAIVGIFLMLKSDPVAAAVLRQAITEAEAIPYTDELGIQLLISVIALLRREAPPNSTGD